VLNPNILLSIVNTHPQATFCLECKKPSFKPIKKT